MRSALLLAAAVAMSGCLHPDGGWIDEVLGDEPRCAADLHVGSLDGMTSVRLEVSPVCDFSVEGDCVPACKAGVRAVVDATLQPSALDQTYVLDGTEQAFTCCGGTDVFTFTIDPHDVCGAEVCSRVCSLLVVLAIQELGKDSLVAMRQHRPVGEADAFRC